VQHAECAPLQHTATHCKILQLTATHCHTLQHAGTPCREIHPKSSSKTHCNTLQHTATHCNTQQRPAESYDLHHHPRQAPHLTNIAYERVMLHLHGAMTHSYVRHGSFIRVLWRICICAAHPYAAQALWSFICGIGTHLTHRNKSCYITHPRVWHDSFICVPWLIYLCATTHP